MRSRISTFRAAVIGVALAVAGVLVLGTTRSSVAAQSAAARSRARGLEGTWRVKVTLYDCTTGAAGAPVWSLVTFARGGTLSGSTSNPLPGQRTSSYGTWTSTAGHTYSAASEAFILFGPGVRPWIQRIIQSIEMTGQDEFISSARVRFSFVPDFDSLPPPSIPLPKAGCANAVGYRFE